MAPMPHSADRRGISPSPMASLRTGGASASPSHSAAAAAARRRSSSRHTDGSRPILQSRPITLWVHEPPNFSTSEIVLSPELLKLFGTVGENDLLEVSLPSAFPDDPRQPHFADADPISPSPKRRSKKRSHHQHHHHRSFVFKPSQGATDSDAAIRTNQLQLSVSKNIANLYGFHNRTQVILSRAPRADNVVSHVELYFRDQYVGRADMWRLTALLDDNCVYVGQKIALAGSVRASIGRMFIKERKVTSGYVAPDTKFIFRSESAKYHLFFQLGKEMWEFDEDGEIYYEKALTGFIPELLRRWKAVPTNHVISIILFTRVWYEENELHMLEEAGLPVRQEQDEPGRWYIDYYKVIVDLESNSNWSEVISMLKEEFFRFQHDILLIGRPVAGPAGAPWQEEQHADLLRRDRALLAGRVAASHEGNILEAINLALNPFDEHYIDRDLNRTGLDLVIVTAGTGHFRVDKNWLRMTTERMIDNGIGLDLVCLTKMPLHSVPLFHFTSHIPDPLLETRNGKRRQQGKTSFPTQQRGSMGAQAGTSSGPPDPLYIDSYTSSSTPAAGPSSHKAPLIEFHSIPHWVDASFYNLQQDKPFRADRFVPRVKMQEIQQIGYMENDVSDISVPFLDLAHLAGKTHYASMLSAGARSMSTVAGSSAGHGRSTGSTGLDAFASREQRRAIRQRFDAETFRDLEFAPPKVRSNTLLTSGGRVSGAGASVAGRSGFRESSLDDKDVQLEKPPGARMSRLNRIGRDSLRGRPALESHAEDDSHEGTADADTSQQTSRPDSADVSSWWSPASRKLDRDSPNFSPSMSTTSVNNLTNSVNRSSRPGSLYSINTLNRGLRPLQPVGKAEAFVAPSQPEDLLEDLPSDASAGKLAKTAAKSAQESAAVALGEQVHGSSLATKAGSLVKSKSAGYKLNANWLWNSLTRASKSRPSSPTDDRAQRAGSVSPTSPRSSAFPNSEASLRIKTLMKGSPSFRNMKRPDSPEHTRKAGSSASASQDGGDGLPKPISIPSNAAPSTSRQGSKGLGSGGAGVTSAEANFQREQEAYEQALEEEEARARYAQRAQVEKQTLVNPSNPKKSWNSHPATNLLLRWQHVYPRRANRHVVKWRSITTPACLPLTTFYLPTEQELLEQWAEYPHTLSVSSDLTSFLVKRFSSETPALAVLRELTSQRLAQGFQFIVPMKTDREQEGGNGTQSRTLSSRRYVSNPGRGNFTLHHPAELFQPGKLTSGNPIFLGMSNQIHRISYDRAAGAINVERYIRKMPYDTSPISYSCCIWPRHLSGYQTVSTSFKYPDFGSYDWTYLDSLAAGHADEEKFTEGLRYWRTRFVIVPSEGRPPPMIAPTGEPLNDEEIRLIGMDRLADLFARARWRGRARSSNARTQATALLRFIPTSLDPSMSMWDEEFMRQMEAAIVEDEQIEEATQAQRASSRAKKQIKDATLDSLVVAMSSEKHGLAVDDRYWNKKFFSATFTGTELTTWLYCQFADVRSRDEAVEWGHKLKQQGLFEHVHGTHGFLDGHYFYRFKGDYAKKIVGGRRGAAKQTKSTPSRAANPATSPRMGTSSSFKSSRRSFEGAAGKEAPIRRRMKMSRTLIIDVDPGRKSDRAETAFLHYDISHNPANGFNAQLHWLGTTARFVEDAVQNWTRTVERYGLRLIEAPIGQICDVGKHNPFQAPVPIRLALPPPEPHTYAHLLPVVALSPVTGLPGGQQQREVRANPNEYFEWALLRRFGFVLDQEASNRYDGDIEITYQSRPNRFDHSQFVHRSGVSFVQVLGGADGFLWLTNRLFNSHVGSQVGPGSGGGGSSVSGNLAGGRGVGGARTPRSPNSNASLKSHAAGAGAGTASGIGRLMRSSSGTSTGGNGHDNPPGSAGPWTPYDPAAWHDEAGLPDPDRARKNFEAFCSDPEALYVFYREVLQQMQAQLQGQGAAQASAQSSAQPGSQSRSHGTGTAPSAGMTPTASLAGRKRSGSSLLRGAGGALAYSLHPALSQSLSQSQIRSAAAGGGGSGAAALGLARGRGTGAGNHARSGSPAARMGGTRGRGGARSRSSGSSGSRSQSRSPVRSRSRSRSRIRSEGGVGMGVGLGQRRRVSGGFWGGL